MLGSSQVPSWKTQTRDLPAEHLGHSATPLYSCHFSPVKRTLLLVLGGFFGGVFFLSYSFVCVWVFFKFHGQSSKMCTQHSPLQECGGVLHDDCNARLALMFARCAVWLRPTRTGRPPPAAAGMTAGRGRLLASLGQTGDAESHSFVLPLITSF